MTQSLRQRHRRAWLSLAVLLPCVLGLGLLVRRSVPVMPGRTQVDARPRAGEPVSR